MVMSWKKEISQNFACHILRPFRLFKDLSNREKIPERLRHFLLIDLHETIVDPITGEFFSGRAAWLRDLVLVMGENQIHPAAMDIEGLA
jgi:hypothetical protein